MEAVRTVNDDEKMRRAQEKYVKRLKSASMKDSALNSRFEFGSTMGADLATPIVSTQDGPRMAGVANFGGKKAAPFVKGGKGRKAVLAKALLKKKKMGKRDTDNDGD